MSAGTAVKIEGIGLHSGQVGRVHLHPAEGPVRLKVDGVDFRPLASNVVDTTRCTTLGVDGVRLMTVEHLLAALWFKGIWSNLLIEVEGPEIPILDGSAKPWMEALVDWPVQPTPPRPIRKPIQLIADRVSAQADPAETFSLLVTIAFKHPSIGYQRFDHPPQPLDLLPGARTFGFMEEVEAMRAQGLVQGASLDNALVFGQTSYLNEPRYTNEPVLHKALDFLGDLYLVGVPMVGRFVVHRGSHQLHVELAKRLQAM